MQDVYNIEYKLFLYLNKKNSLFTQKNKHKNSITLFKASMIFI